MIATSHPLDVAVAGRFSQGLVEVMENSPNLHLKSARADQFIDPDKLAAAVQDALGDAKSVVKFFEQI